MRYGEIPGVGKPVSRIAQGTTMISREEIDEGLALLDATFEAGITLYDTAYIYGEDNERIPSEWVHSRGVRDQFVMLGKGAHPDAEGNHCNPEDIAQQLHASLDHMGFDYIDLYVLHRDDPDVPVGEIVGALNEHVREGKIHAFGGSNWSYQRLREANAYAEANGLVPFAVSNPNFSLAICYKPVWEGCLSIQGPDGEAARRWYADTHMALVTWSSVARGFFSGRFTRADYEEKKELLDECTRESFCTPDNFQRLDHAYELAAAKGATVPQVALAYVLDHPLNIFALVGAASPEEVRSNLGALEVGLSPEELAWLNLESDAL